MDTDVFHAVTAQCFLTNFFDYSQSWFRPLSYYPFHVCVSGRDMAAVFTLFTDKDKPMIKQLVHLLP